MNLKSGFIFFLGLVGCILFSWQVVHSAEIDPYPNVIIPIYEGGYTLHKDFDASMATKSIRYYVKTDSSPAEVLEFYDAYFNGRGWRSSFETCQRNWEDLSEGRQANGPLLKRLFASWEHSEQNLKAVLWLTYQVVKEGRLTEVTVKCQLQPKVDD